MNEEKLLEEYTAVLQRSLEDFKGKDTMKLGFGKTPGILVVDMHRGATVGARQRTNIWDAEVEATRTLLDVARANDVPAFFATNEFRTVDEMGLFGERSGGDLTWYRMRGSEWTEIDERLDVQPNEQVFSKTYPSAFFGTDLTSRLNYKRVDTLLITGLTTSGCIRASTVDCLAAGFRPILVRDCIGDRMPFAHVGNMYDLEFKYADGVNLDRAIEYLQQLGDPSDAEAQAKTAV